MYLVIPQPFSDDGHKRGHPILLYRYSCRQIPRSGVTMTTPPDVATGNNRRNTFSTRFFNAVNNNYSLPPNRHTHVRCRNTASSVKHSIVSLLEKVNKEKEIHRDRERESWSNNFSRRETLANAEKLGYGDFQAEVWAGRWDWVTHPPIDRLRKMSKVANRHHQVMMGT